MAQSWRRIAWAVFVSSVYHAAVIVLIVVALHSDAPAARDVSRAEHPPAGLIFRIEARADGGGGGGGNRMKQPPRRAELPGDQGATVAVMRPVRLELPAPAINETNPVEHVVIPAERQASGVEALVGAMASFASETVSQGLGRDGDAGTGDNGGIGRGRGRGLGDGFDQGMGGDRGTGAGVVMPRILREVKPQYTADAMNARIQGSVVIACIVMPDGSVGDVRVMRSLDPIFGLDREAINAAKQWRFWPGTRLGKPVPVRVTIELAFSIR
jgi:protein TonB